MQHGHEVLAASRPTAVNLFWALQRMKEAQLAHVHLDQSALAAKLLALAHEISSEDVRINRAMGDFGAALLKDGARVLTHCNAGALATAGHGTALGVIRSAVEAGKKISVFADETRPFLQGARLTAWEMVQENIPVTLITDNMAGHLMKCGEIDAVIVGTDRVAANGDVANKIGTYSIAVAAHHHGIPFVVCAPWSTVDPQTATGGAIAIEMRDGSEVRTIAGLTVSPDGTDVWNPAFDITPSALVTAIVTDRGVHRAPFAFV